MACRSRNFSMHFPGKTDDYNKNLFKYVEDMMDKTLLLMFLNKHPITSNNRLYCTERSKKGLFIFNSSNFKNQIFKSHATSWNTFSYVNLIIITKQAHSSQVRYTPRRHDGDFTRQISSSSSG